MASKVKHVIGLSTNVTIMIENNHENEDHFFQPFQSSSACCTLDIHRPQTLQVGETPPPWPPSIKCLNIRTCHGEGIIIELKVEEILAHARIQGKVKIWSKIWSGH